MSNLAIAQPPQQLGREIQEWKSPAQIRARIQAIKQLLETALKKDVDYGVIPGTGRDAKPTLLKPGSEQILAMFQIAVRPIVEELSNEDCFRYRVTCELTNALTQDFLGAGIGEASTNETKYKWRRTYSKKEWENTPFDRRRIKYGQKRDEGQYVEYEEMQVRQEPADLSNTVLKIAKKRAQIDATLTVTGASSMFEQDLEDLTDETREEMGRQKQPRGSKKNPPQATGDVMCASCGQVNKHSPECKHFRGKCPKCNAEGGHLPSCEFRHKPEQAAEGEKPQQEENKDLKWALRIKAIDARQKTEKDKKGAEHVKHFRIVTGINAANANVTAYAWDTKLFERLDAVKPGTTCIFTVKANKSGEQTYYAIDQIVEITGEEAPTQRILVQDDPDWK